MYRILLLFVFFDVSFSYIYTNPGSYYIFKGVADYYIGDRAQMKVVGNNLTHRIWTDFTSVIGRSINSLESVPHFINTSKNFLLIGDSTERYLVRDYCELLRRNISKTKVRLVESFNVHHYICTVEISNKVKFQIANLFIFGYTSSLNSKLAYEVIHRHALNRDRSIQTKHILLQTLNGSTAFLLETFNTSQIHYLSLHSCLWDLNEHEGLHDKFYTETFALNYFVGARNTLSLLRLLQPNVPITLSTCKPMNLIDPVAGAIGQTRFRDGQVVLDGMLKMLQKNIVNDTTVQLIDASQLLIGFEHFATDGRHYFGRAANTLMNAYLNSFLD